MKRACMLCLFLAVLVPARAQAPAQHFDGKTWWSYVSALAADNMEGRETGSEGLRKAQAWMVEQLKLSGIGPAGSNGYYQPVPFIERTMVEKGSTLALVRGGKSEPLTLGEEAFFGTRVDLAPQVDAPLVFAGYGL